MSQALLPIATPSRTYHYAPFSVGITSTQDAEDFDSPPEGEYLAIFRVRFGATSNAGVANVNLTNVLGIGGNQFVCETQADIGDGHDHPETVIGKVAISAGDDLQAQFICSVGSSCSAVVELALIG